jgi:predicted RNase H-like nuclease (RuvC/YqgF family)
MEAYLKDGKRERLSFKIAFAEEAVARGNWQEVEPAQSTSFVVGSAALARMQQKIARQKQQINSSLSYTESLEARNKVLRSENERLKTLDAYQQTQPAYKLTNDALFKRCEQLERDLKEMTERKDLLKRTAEVLSRKLLGGAER